MLISNIFTKVSEAMARRWQLRPLVSAHEISLMASLSLMAGTLIFSRGLLTLLLLKLTNTTVLLFSNVSLSGSLVSPQVFMPAVTLLGEVSIFLQPTATIDYSSLIKFLDQERQLSPSSFIKMPYWKLHYLGLRGSGAMRTLRVPSLEAMARQRPNDLLGMNLMSSMALFSGWQYTEFHSFFSPSPLSVFFNSYILICVSMEQVAMIVPNYGRAHLTFQAEAPCILMTPSSIHFYPFLENILSILSLQAAASLLPVQSKLMSWTMTLGGRSPTQSMLTSEIIMLYRERQWHGYNIFNRGVKDDGKFLQHESCDSNFHY